MKVQLNGQIRDFEKGHSLLHLIDQFCKDSRHVIAELNGQIIKSPLWPETPLHDGDHIELIRIVGGG